MKRNVFLRFVSFFSVFILISSLLTGLSLSVSASEEPVIQGNEQVFLYNVDYDTVIYHSEYSDINAKDYQIYPASTVKLMTGLLACELLMGRLAESITVTSKMLDEVKGNNMALQVGEIVTVEDMLYGLLTNCANDAAQVIAITISGSLEAFVELMNDKAKMLGMYNTNYTNVTGMHDKKMYTTLRDTILLVKACYANELLMAATSEIKHVVNATNKTMFRNLYNRNCLISTFYNSSKKDYRYTGVQGMNAGYTPQGGYCVISSCTRNNLTYLCIVMNGSENEDGIISSYDLTMKYFDWVFSSYARKKVLSSGDIITEMPVSLSSSVDYVQLKADFGENEVLYCYLPTDVDIKKEISYSWYTFDEELQAPVAKGVIVGTITVLYNNQVIGTANLVTSNDIDRSDLLYLLSRIEEFTSTKFFIVSIISFVVLFVLYVISEATKEERKAKRNRTFASPVSISISPSFNRKPKVAKRRPDDERFIRPQSMDYQERASVRSPQQKLPQNTIDPFRSKRQ